MSMNRLSSLRRQQLASALISALMLPASGVISAQETDTPPTAKDLDKVVVTGSRIPRAGFDTLEPAAVIDRSRIEGYAQTNLMESLLDVPSMSAGASYRGNQASFGAGVNFASRFGLGSNRLLTLVNGRRFVTSNPPTVFGPANGGVQVDLNAIPSIMVDRVENLGVGGAPTYGSDAIAGVTNIILRENYEGAEVQLGWGQTSKADNERQNWSAIFGSNFADGRGNVTIAVEFDNSEGVNALQRQYYRDGYSLQTNPNAALAASLQPWRTPANDGRYNAGIPFNTGPMDGIADQVWIRDRRIASMTFGGLLLPNTTAWQRNALGEIRGFGPNNLLWHFDNTGNLVSFDPGISYAGGSASGGDGLNLNETVPLIADLNRRSVYSVGHFDFSDRVRGFFELSRYESEAQETLDQNVYNAASFGAAFANGTGVQSGSLPFRADNPFLSPQARQVLAENGITQFRLSRSSRDLSMNNASSDSALTRVVAGVEGYFSAGARNYDWNASLTHGRGDFDYLGTGLIQQNFINAINVTQDASGNIVCNSAAAGTVADANCRPLNLFGEGLASPEALAYVSTPTRAEAESRQTVFNTSLTGGLFDLPGGEFAFAIGYEHRRESGGFTPSEYQRLGQGRSVPIQAASGRYNTNEYFGEVLAPLVNPDAGIPGLHRLDLTAKVRRVDNSVAGWFTSYTYGLQYEPFAGVQLRGNRTESFRAPSIAELYTTLQPAFYSIPEACTQANINGGTNPAARRRNCDAFFAAYGVDPIGFQAAPTTQLGTTNGSTSLLNEKARSWTAGIVLAPEWIPGLRVAADWYDIEVTDVISSLSPTDIVNGCFDSEEFNASDVNNANRFCSLISRDPTTGVANGIATEYANGPVLMFRGWTGEVDYRWNLGDYGNLNLGWYGYFPKERGQASAPGVPFIEQVGSVNEPERVFRWTAQYGVGRWSAGVTAFYQSSARFNLTATEESREYLYQDSWTTWDANIGYALTENARINLAVTNLTDDIGPFPYVLDALGRSYMATFRYRFK
jgi:outer membrane receptor protein involved in Fe transport